VIDPKTSAPLVGRAKELTVLALVVNPRPHPRPDELNRLIALLDSRGATRLELGPRDDSACAELVEALVGARPGPSRLGQTAGAAGNPLFVSERVATLIADGAIQREGGVADIAAAEITLSLPMTICTG
jgi:predicted ATPase